MFEDPYNFIDAFAAYEHPEGHDSNEPEVWELAERADRVEFDDGRSYGVWEALHAAQTDYIDELLRFYEVLAPLFESGEFDDA